MIVSVGLRRALKSVFSPAKLFSSGEQGVWFDPSDFSTMFQDAAGTTPVTAVEQPVGLILDKSKGLALSSELVTNGTFDNNIDGWTAGSGRSNISWNNGKLRVSTTQTEAVGKSAYQAFPVTAGKWYLISGSAILIAGSVTTVQVALRDGISSETSLSVATTNVRLDTVPSGSAYYYADTTRTLYLHCRFFNTSQPCSVDFDNISVKEIAGNHATQSTPTSRPVLKQDETGRYYLLFDGTDDGLATASIDFTATNKMTVFAGVRKLSDAASGTLAELSVDAATNRAFNVFAPSRFGGNFSYRVRSTGSLSSDLTIENIPAPITNVITTICSISDNILRFRVNGSQVAESTSDQGTGNYGDFPFYIGNRAGTLSRFNGRLYSLIVRGAESTADQITNTETWVNAKTGAY
jgi:hypothetical protein